MSFGTCQKFGFFFNLLVIKYALLQGAQALLFNMEDMAPSVCFNSPFCTLKQISCKVSICIYHSNCHNLYMKPARYTSYYSVFFFFSQVFWCKDNVIVMISC